MTGADARVTGSDSPASDREIRPLSVAEIATDAFRRLLWRAAEVDDDALKAIVTDELPALTVLGTVEAGEVSGFVAFDDRGDVVVIEYIAVSEAATRGGRGHALVDAIRARVGEKALFAQTDDDAVDFYRRVGFAVSAAGEADPRWPDRRRYDCLLSAR